ncbi:hypothetical protein GLOIN_2v1764928 [Rhizophagus irregularis DAOM 181602=DAOM 197198]|nr:hypothetical protein GLOIN_2v1764928 [Rhizophagus irregularis DAOM 181602=DAOM 197198]
MAFRRFKTLSKYNRGLGMEWLLLQTDRLDFPFDFLLDRFPLTNRGFPTLRTLLDGRFPLQILLDRVFYGFLSG